MAQAEPQPGDAVRQSWRERRPGLFGHVPGGYVDGLGSTLSEAAENARNLASIG